MGIRTCILLHVYGTSRLQKYSDKILRPHHVSYVADIAITFFVSRIMPDLIQFIQTYLWRTCLKRKQCSIRSRHHIYLLKFDLTCLRHIWTMHWSETNVFVHCPWLWRFMVMKFGTGFSKVLLITSLHSIEYKCTTVLTVRGDHTLYSPHQKNTPLAVFARI